MSTRWPGTRPGTITRKTFAYTNHTLLPEALERWPLEVFGRVLPRHCEIIYEINAHFLEEVRIRFLRRRGAHPAHVAHRRERRALCAHGAPRLRRQPRDQRRGGAAHRAAQARRAASDFYELWPEKFSNKTNGVTPRRWMALSNPRLAELITEHIGDGWIKDLAELQAARAARRGCRVPRALARDQACTTSAASPALALERTGIIASIPIRMFDVQVKRIHEYKRQHLNILHIVSLYHRTASRIRGLDVQPRTFIFGGKAAPGYHLAKLMIKLITAVGDVINRDPDVRGRLKVVFLPNFNVTNGQRIYPAADLSEQISTAGKEASGTGNMKFCMNGALTIGTLDGANIEIREEVGAENFFLFGLIRRGGARAEVARLSAHGLLRRATRNCAR